MKEDKEEKDKEKPSDEEIDRMEESWANCAPEEAKELFKAKKRE